MTIEEQIKVMEAYTEGKQIQSKPLFIFGHWSDDAPSWNWHNFKYRVKPEIPSKQIDKSSLYNKFVRVNSDLTHIRIEDIEYVTVNDDANSVNIYMKSGNIIEPNNVTFYDENGNEVEFVTRCYNDSPDKGVERIKTINKVCADISNELLIRMLSLEE